MPIVVMANDIRYAITADHLNTPRRATTVAGNLHWLWGYSAFDDEAPTIADRRFNKVPALESDFNINLHYPGQYFDSESGLHYNYFRSYSPTTGRYTQADPIGLEGRWNRSSYVGNNPSGVIDSTGLTEETLTMLTALSSVTAIFLASPAACGISLAGAEGYALGNFIYPHIEGPLSSIIERYRSVHEQSSKSPFWQGFKPYREKTKTNGESGKRRRYFEWDHTHGDVEVYDRRGNHLGSAFPETGEQTKPSVPVRGIDL